jgi:hypothetical protein
MQRLETCRPPANVAYGIGGADDGDGVDEGSGVTVAGSLHLPTMRMQCETLRIGRVL